MSFRHMFGMHLLPSWTLRTGPVSNASADFIEIWSDERDLKICRSAAPGSVRYRMDFGGLVAVEINPGKRQITRRDLVDGISQTTFEHFLADQVVPRILAFEKQLVVHAAAVQKDGSALLFLGDSGSGKSTLATSFVGSGWKLMGDDAIIFSNSGAQPMAGATYPSLRLLPDAIQRLFSEPVSSRRVAHYSMKQHVEVSTFDVSSEGPFPVKAIFVLDRAIEQCISVRKLSVAEACMAIVRNSFALDPLDSEHSRFRFNSAGDIARTLSAYTISYPHEYDRLSEVREAIRAAK